MREPTGVECRGCHSNYQIGVNRTKSEIPSTKSGTFLGLAFFLMLIYKELNFDTDCFSAYVR